MMDVKNIAAARAEIIGGADITSMRSMFDKDDKNIITFSSRQIQYHDVQSTNPIASAHINTSNLHKTEILVDHHRLDNSLALFTNFGRIFVWSLEERCWLNEINLPIKEEESLVACKLLSKRQYIYTVLNNETNACTINYSMSRSERERPKSREELGQCSSGASTSFDLIYAIADLDSTQSSKKDINQRVLAYMNDQRVEFRLVAINEKVSSLKFARTISEKLTCVRGCKSKPMIAVGDARGRIYVYTGDYRTDKLFKTFLHWHSLPVSDMCFSSTGNTLYSVGGESGCVVIWDMSPNNIGQKRVVARLGMPIKFINCANDHNQVVISFEDNDVAILDKDQKCQSIKNLTKRTYKMFHQNDYKALRLPFPKAQLTQIETQIYQEDNKCIGLLGDPKAGIVITNGQTGCIQIFDTIKQSRVKQLNLLRHKTLSLESNSKVMPSDIVKGALSSDGCWLACYETRECDGYFPEVLLHIYQRQVWIQTIDRLHECPDISDLRFSPDGRFLVSVCKDGSFHVLHRITLDSKVTENAAAKQMYVKGFSGHAPTGLPEMAAFSHDSSVLAISLKNDTVLIWMIEDPYKLVYECQLNQDLSDVSSSHVLGLHFGHHQDSEKNAPFCEVRSKGIRIWNVLNPHSHCSYKATDALKLSGTDEDNQSTIFTATAFDTSESIVNFAVSTTNNLIIFFKLDITVGITTLNPLFYVDGNLSFNRYVPPIYTHMCFMEKTILEIDLDCHADTTATKLLSRLCILNSYEELVSFTDKLTLERRHASNNCNEIKSLEINQLQDYFKRSCNTYDEEAKKFRKSINLTDSGDMTEKQHRIRCKLEVQKMLKGVFSRIPSHKLPEMDILGPLILDKLVFK